MDRLDDYRDEMERLDSEQIEGILSGGDLDDPVAQRASNLIAEVRDALWAEPPPEVAARHLASMHAAAHPAEPEKPRTLRRTPLFTRRRATALGLAATLILGAGIAGAITLPDHANDRAEEVIPAELPPDTPGPAEPANEASAHGAAVSAAAHDDALEGCEKGQGVSEVASAKASEHRRDADTRPDPCEQAQNAAGGGSGGGSGGPGGGGGSGGGGSTVGSGGGGGSGGPGDAPVDVPIPDELPTP